MPWKCTRVRVWYKATHNGKALVNQRVPVNASSLLWVKIFNLNALTIMGKYILLLSGIYFAANDLWAKLIVTRWS